MSDERKELASDTTTAQEVMAAKDALTARDEKNAPDMATAQDAKITWATEIFRDAYEVAKDLAESYNDLKREKEFYEKQLGTYAHYTLDDAYYLLLQGSHEQSERVQTSGISKPIERAVLHAERLQQQLNAEIDVAYRKEVLEPYQRVCEKMHLFEECMRSLDKQERHIAEQLYIVKESKAKITDLNGRPVSRKRVEKYTHTILDRLAWILSKYGEYLHRGNK